MVACGSRLRERSRFRRRCTMAGQVGAATAPRAGHEYISTADKCRFGGYSRKRAQRTQKWGVFSLCSLRSFAANEKRVSGPSTINHHLATWRDEVRRRLLHHPPPCLPLEFDCAFPPFGLHPLPVSYGNPGKTRGEVQHHQRLSLRL